MKKQAPEVALMPEPGARVRVQDDAYPHDRFGWHNGRYGTVTRDRESRPWRRNSSGGVSVLVSYDHDPGWHPRCRAPWPRMAYPPPKQAWIPIGLLRHVKGPQCPVPRSH